jgi:ABC-type molybdenum transport system ATPase subunit/photorepair protein PhrA
MSGIAIVRETSVTRTPRVMQLEGIFELAPSERSVERWTVNLDLPQEWNIGLIVGPSGSGKTTVARELFGDYIVKDWQWSQDKSIVDDFPRDMSIKGITELLSSVGFSSPPSWVRPFRVLSNGEQFRVNMARTLAENKELSVVDEFTSVVDRTVAQIGSAAIAKTVRRRKQRFIAVSCHYDIIDWLEPDWVYKPQTNEFYTGRYLHQRPKISFTVRRVHSSAWEYFRRFHYLDDGLNKSARCFVAYIDNEPAAFCAVLSFPHATSPGWRFHRLVCLPDYQGVGIGVVFADYVASIFAATGKPIYRNLAHPAVIHACYKSKVWAVTRAPSRTANIGRTAQQPWKHATFRFTAGFRYTGAAMDKQQAYELLGKDLPIRRLDATG